MLSYIDDLKRDFDNDVFENINIFTRRIPTWGRTGITEHKPFDKKALKIFENIVDEAILRIEQKEENE
ncbi:hypothetical protein RSA37_03240 [Mammaliicoccus sciuri]|uniref:hypothetical protein n=1 Tax=Mammaliicoccus sciuri TaxID=1296 RepID=UPI00073416CC|nr:hypothetical protein [Mammaliicoccus sciuri]KTT85192.1 hypothetical protein NS1R_07640 [Mammaliicoccus sciuri]KTT88005.1 hypothetical protein NS36R_11600 [Mammaliicoccus sciuri]KTT90260.1 hypothetical protein NS112_03810 [Mammaliicoccus sciuri]KTT94650.1 hypothetical protein NS44R_04520 [Mammaliicoccus sciuri]KTW13323.1 hypothetical protein RSA37_03240 [Mammaliicoccus sciuri]